MCCRGDSDWNSDRESRDPDTVIEQASVVQRAMLERQDEGVAGVARRHMAKGQRAMAVR